MGSAREVPVSGRIPSRSAACGASSVLAECQNDARLPLSVLASVISAHRGPGCHKYLINWAQFLPQSRIFPSSTSPEPVSHHGIKDFHETIRQGTVPRLVVSSCLFTAIEPCQVFGYPSPSCDARCDGLQGTNGHGLSQHGWTVYAPRGRKLFKSTFCMHFSISFTQYPLR